MFVSCYRLDLYYYNEQSSHVTNLFMLFKSIYTRKKIKICIQFLFNFIQKFYSVKILCRISLIKKKIALEDANLLFVATVLCTMRQFFIIFIKKKVHECASYFFSAEFVYLPPRRVGWDLVIDEG